MPALTKAQQKQAQAAEESFNRTYATQYGEDRWQQSLLPALEAPTRYATLLNSFEGTEIPAVFSKDDGGALERIEFPQLSAESKQDGEAKNDSLHAYRRARIESAETEAAFPAPQAGTNALLTHWNLDAASLLAVSILAPVPGDKILDLCAAPGGKSLALAQLLRPADFDASAPSLKGGCLHSNEMDHGRNKRLNANLAAYLPAPLLKSGEVKVLKLDGATANAALQLPLGMGAYDRVLLDAPCSSERHVIHAHVKARRGGRAAAEMTSWRSGQSKKTAKTQAALLMTALQALRVGGRVLYATCSLSSDENDGVVEKVRELVQKDKKKFGIKWDFAVRSADWEGSALEQWAQRTSHGWIALPDHPSGGAWGPLFFAVLEKIAS